MIDVGSRVHSIGLPGGDKHPLTKRDLRPAPVPRAFPATGLGISHPDKDHKPGLTWTKHQKVYTGSRHRGSRRAGIHSRGTHHEQILLQPFPCRPHQGHRQGRPHEHQHDSHCCDNAAPTQGCQRQASQGITRSTGTGECTGDEDPPPGPKPAPAHHAHAPDGPCLPHRDSRRHSWQVLGWTAPAAPAR